MLASQCLISQPWWFKLCMNNRIVIEGITKDGQKFRPSDWAERVSGSMLTFKNQRMYYSPLLRPSYHQGNKCIVLDHALKDSNPELFAYIIEFAEKNNLRFCHDDEISKET